MKLLQFNGRSLPLAAVFYATHGIPVFPCAGKRPLTPHGFKDATADLGQVRTWWKQHPEANMGTPTGLHSFVLDVDLPDGPISLARLEKEFGPLPNTLEQRTGSGGRHLFLALPQGIDVRNSAGKLGPGLDIRGNGGYVILPPSIHPNGAAYEWVNELAPAPAPDWLIQAMTTKAELPSGGPNPNLGPKGARNDTLNRLAFSFGQQVAKGDMPNKAARQILNQSARSAGLGTRETESTIRSGLEAGLKAVNREERNNPFNSLDVHGWPTPHPAMFHGFAGEFARFATVHSEADPVAVLATLLCRFGIEVGRKPHMLAGEPQCARLNAVLVGQSSKARKGTSARPVRELFRFPETEWLTCRFSPGPLSSGEGLVYAVRDPQQEYIIDKRNGNGREMMVDPGVDDKRLFVLDQEFASALSCTRREGNTLSTIIRALFDGDKIEPLTKTSKLTATDPHVGIVTHVTLHELHRKLDATEALNGFANRFLWLCVRRPKLVAFPEELSQDKLHRFRTRLLGCLQTARDRARLRFDDAARNLWAEMYPQVATDRPALLGSILNRAEVYVRRLALTYALLDGSACVTLEHLRAALDFWRFNEDSAAFIFGGFESDPVEQRIVNALAEAGGSLDTTGLYKVFGNHLPKAQLTVAMNTLSAAGKIRIEERKPAGGGRPARIFHLSENCEETNLLPSPESE